MLAIISTDNKWVYIDQVIGSIEPLLIDHFSERHPRIQFIDVQQQRWDGWYRKYDERTSRIARPLLQELKNLAKKHNWPFQIEDRRPTVNIDPQYDPEMLGGITLYPYQMEAIKTMHPQKNEVGVISVVTGGGKCLGKGTPVIMYDGSIKKVEDVKTGDFLMGDDSKRRKVLSICNGQEQLYRIDQKNGDPYIVNESHILSLKRTPDGRSKSKDYQVNDISITDYLNSSKSQKHLLKGYKVPVSFKQKDVPFDPYFLGLWLGDGVAVDLQICVGETDNEIVEYLERYCCDNNLILVKYPDNREAADIYALRLYEGRVRPPHIKPLERNWLKQAFRDLNLFKNKHIPTVFKYNDEQSRLALLAGFIDADGYVDYKDTCSIVHRQMPFIKDVVFIARSLGFKVTCNPCRKKCTTTGYEGDYWRVTISGNIDRIPTKLSRKQAKPRRSKKNPLICGITITPIGVGDYYGFEIDGNKRFLLGDFTVTHNTECMAAVTKAYNLPTVIIADQRIVIEQIKERLELRDIVDNSTGVGLFYGGARPNGQTIVVGSIQSLTSPPVSLKRKNFQQWKKRSANAKAFQDIVKQSELLLVDECDRACDKRYRSLFMKYFTGRYKYGFSGTPFDKSKPVEALILKEHLGSIIYNIPRKEVEKAGAIIPVHGTMIAVGENGDKRDRTAYDIAQRELVIENDIYHQKIKQIVDAFPDDRTMILVDTHNVTDLGQALEQKIPGSIFIYGKTSTKKRKEALDAFKNGDLKCLIGGKILKRGLDVKGGVHNLIICGGGKLWSDFDQKVGRSVRKNDRGYARLFFFLHLDNYYLYRHSKEQLKSMLNMGYNVKVIVNGATIDGAELVKRKFRLPK
jgi:superfamily II DNA or RNA helicase